MLDRSAGGQRNFFKGALHLKSQDLKAALWRMKASPNMNKVEFKSQVDFLDLLAFEGQWEQLLAQASQAILRSESSSWNARFYRFWIEALKETHDVEGLQRLGKHLLSLRELGPCYQALACLCFVSSGRKKFGRVLYRDMVLSTWKSKKHWMVWEAMCAWLADSPEEKDRLKGVSLYLGLSKRKPQNYLLSRGALEAALDSDEWEGAAGILNSMAKHFPFAPEHALISARAQLQSGAVETAVDILEDYFIVNSENPDAILLMAQALENQGKAVEACQFMGMKANHFDPDDYDYNVLRGQLEKKRFESTKEGQSRIEAIRYLAFALRFSIRVGQQDGVLHSMLHQLSAGVGEETFARPELGEQKDSETRILFLSDILADGFFKAESWFLPSPTNLSKGEIIFVAVAHPDLVGIENIIGSFEVGGPAVPDRAFGSGVVAIRVKKLTKPLQIELHNLKYPLVDKWGCENFARKGTARFFEVPSEIGESIHAKAKIAA